MAGLTTVCFGEDPPISRDHIIKKNGCLPIMSSWGMTKCIYQCWKYNIPINQSTQIRCSVNPRVLFPLEFPDRLIIELKQ
jgi:hypothetical protein